MIEIPRKKSNQKYVILFLLLLVLFTTFFIMYKYHVEGEKNIPFNITKIVLVSSAKTEDIEINENIYEANVIQKNDIYLAIEKNKDYSKEDAIKKITLNNFQIIQNGNKGALKFYRTSSEANKFDYTEEYEIKDSVEYIGSKKTNLKLENMTLSNQGGLIEISGIIDDLGKVTYSENDDISADGRLLNRLQITNEEIKHTFSFDMIIELTSGKAFKTVITIELPTGNIVKDGVTTNEIDLSKLVFKRI